MRNQSGKPSKIARSSCWPETSADSAGGGRRAYVRSGGSGEVGRCRCAVVREKSFDEFHLYTLERPATLRDNETKQVEFVRATGIQSQRLYVYDGAPIEHYGYYNNEIDPQ